MLFRQRERFERSDVPTASPVRNVVSALVLVAVVAGIYMLVTTLWHRANQVNGLGDRSLRLSVRSQASASEPGEGVVASDHDLTTTLLLSRLDDGTLGQARLLCIDETEGAGVLANVPLDTKLASADGVTSLAALFAEQGAAACIAPFASASGVPVGHVVVAGPDILDQLDQLRDMEMVTLLGSAADVLETITTDMSTGDLLDLASKVQSVGISNLQLIDAPASPEQLEDGRTLSVIDQTQLGLALGTIVPVDPQPAPEEAVPEGGEG